MDIYCLRNNGNTERNWLKVSWDNTLPSLLIIAKNPSKANELRGDNTTTRCIYYAKLNGYGSIILINFETHYCTNVLSNKYIKNNNIINLFVIMINILTATSILCAWGGCKFIKQRKKIKKYIINLLSLSNAKLYCLKIGFNKEPYHPAHRGAYIKKFIKYDICK